ncbi:hypothetical protein [Antribacter gilvus]|uniref:hypothetical protein n=1 Tax=Antribacter gilvus TaxID=2304675 RepID=UPI000F7AA99F|nr:hypothetical protein [Antribacter gilvus]
MGGLGDMFDKAKDFVTDADNVEKAKGYLTDENVDGAAEKLKEFAPDNVDGFVDTAADKAKEFGGQ